MSIDPESGATIPENGSSPFPNPGEVAQDYDAQAQAEVLTQYRESTKLKSTISALMGGWQALEDCMVNISKQRDPAIAEGVNLDVVGELVGQSRVLSNGTVAGDIFYRTMIAARIARNKSIGSSPELIAALETVVFIGSPFRFFDLGHMAVGLEVPGEPNSDQKALINSDLMPKAMAVGFGKGWFVDATYFGFVEDPDALGFGEIGDPPPPGGHLGEIF